MGAASRSRPEALPDPRAPGPSYRDQTLRKAFYRPMSLPVTFAHNRNGAQALRRLLEAG